MFIRKRNAHGVALVAGVAAVLLLTATSAQAAFIAVAYHDFGGQTASTGYITTHQVIASPLGFGHAQDTSPKSLINYADGSSLGVTFQITEAGGGFDNRDNVTGPPAAGTPADALFNVPGLNLDNGLLAVGTGDGTMEFTLSGLNPGYLYDLAFYGHRDTTPNGVERFTLGGAVSASNISSTGINSDTVTELGTRPNTAGHVVHWTNINPGNDGTITVTTDPSVGGGSNIAYLNAMRLAVIPEPSTFVMFFTGALLLMLRRRRRVA